MQNQKKIKSTSLYIIMDTLKLKWGNELAKIEHISYFENLFNKFQTNSTNKIKQFTENTTGLKARFF